MLPLSEQAAESDLFVQTVFGKEQTEFPVHSPSVELLGHPLKGYFAKRRNPNCPNMEAALLPLRLQCLYNLGEDGQYSKYTMPNHLLHVGAKQILDDDPSVVSHQL